MQAEKSREIFKWSMVMGSYLVTFSATAKQIFEVFLFV